MNQKEIEKLMSQLVRFEIFAMDKEYNWLCATPKWPDLNRIKWGEENNETAQLNAARETLTPHDEEDAEYAVKLIKIAAADLERPIFPIKLILTMINHPFEAYDFHNVSYRLKNECGMNYSPALCELLYTNGINAIQQHLRL